MDSAEKPKKRGRPRKEERTKTVPVTVDEATLIKLDALVEYGGYGTSRGEIVMFIVRVWLRDNHDKLRSDIVAKHTPFGPAAQTAEDRNRGD